MTSTTGPVAAERAYAYTKERILAGTLAGGDLVSEGVIGGELGISRTPVHEAFLRLDSEQLLTLVSRKGAIVRPMTPTEAADVLAMRHGVETAAAGQVFTAGGPAPEFADRLADNLRRQQGLVDDGDVDGFVEADDEFHATMVSASGNPIAADFYDRLRSRQQRLRNLLLRIDVANLAASYADHRVLAERLTAGDRAGFDQMLADHFGRYRGAI